MEPSVPPPGISRVLKSLFRQGLMWARINMGHSNYEVHAQTIKNIRQASVELKKEIGILLDLQGPKIRVGKIPNPLHLKEGEIWMMGTESNKKKHSKYIPTPCENIVNDCHKGARVLFDDGLIVAVIPGEQGRAFKN